MVPQVFTGKWRRTPVAIKLFNLKDDDGEDIEAEARESLKQVCREYV